MERVKRARWARRGCFLGVVILIKTIFTSRQVYLDFTGQNCLEPKFMGDKSYIHIQGGSPQLLGKTIIYNYLEQVGTMTTLWP